MVLVPILPILNTLLPQMISLYKTVRTESRALDQNAQAFTDADLIELLRQESADTVATADAILARLGPPPDTD